LAASIIGGCALSSENRTILTTRTNRPEKYFESSITRSRGSLDFAGICGH